MKFILNIDDDRYEAITNPRFASKNVKNMQICLGLRAIKCQEDDVIDITPVLNLDDKEALEIAEHMLLSVVGSVFIIAARNNNKTQE